MLRYRLSACPSAGVMYSHRMVLPRTDHRMKRPEEAFFKS